MAIRILRGLKAKLHTPQVATIGKFDGLHLGHQQLLTSLKHESDQQGQQSLVISFYQNPSCYFSPKIPKKKILSLRDQLSVLAQYPIDNLLLLRFNSSLANLSAQDFIRELLLSQLNIQTLIVGPDAAVGRDREGNIDFLDREFRKAGKVLQVREFLNDRQVKISSLMIREAINLADFKRYESLTGRQFYITAAVGCGRQLGRQLGFPTANFYLRSIHLPPLGVYATTAELGGKTYRALTNIGIRPTVDPASDRVLVETFLLDYVGADFYQQKLRVKFLTKIRNEIKFPNIQSLQAQLKGDLETRVKLG